MKLGPATKLNKRNKTTSKKKMAMTSCSKIVTSLPCYQSMANLDPEAGFRT